MCSKLKREFGAGRSRSQKKKTVEQSFDGINLKTQNRDG